MINIPLQKFRATLAWTQGDPKERNLVTTIHSLPESAQVPGESSIRRTYFTEENFIDEWIQDYTGECSFCGQRLELPAIKWCMPTGTLWLHLACCSDLGLSLAKDAARYNYVHKNRIQNTVAKLTDRAAA